VTSRDEVKLIRYDAMCQAIDRCESVDEAKAIRDKAVALAAYAKQATNRDNERKCCEIRIRAERRAGELLKETAKNGTRRPKGKSHVASSDMRESPTLKAHHISRDQSSDWQKLADIPQKRFEQELKKPGVPSTNQILENVYPKKREPDPLERVDRDALTIWGVLSDLERNKLLKRDPAELFRTMTAPMKKDVVRLVPVVIPWLEKLTEAL
jgi:hypothetical protein